MNLVAKMKNGGGVKLLICCKKEYWVVSELANSVDKGWSLFYFRWYNHLNPAIIKDKELTKFQIDKLF